MEPLSAGRRIAALIGKADNAPGVIRAYHGSPHSFSRFDASKIGTGEGAQSFGYGLYFAGHEGVARGYREALAGKYPPILIGDQPVEEAIEALPDIDDRLRSRYIARQLPLVVSRVDGMTGLNDQLLKEATLARMRDAAEEGQMPLLGPEHLEALLQGRSMRLGKRPGHMYEVEIGYPEEALLDLDSPIGDQPQAIQDALGSYGRAPWHFTFGQENWRGFNALSRIKDNLSGSRPAAARTLLERGIPGARYFDGVSRSSGEGTRNYVMFPGTEDRIRILRQYGLLPPLVGAGMAQEE